MKYNNNDNIENEKNNYVGLRETIASAALNFDKLCYNPQC